MLTVTRFGTGDDRLSRCASALLVLARSLDSASDEIDAFYAPRECFGLVVRATTREALATLTQYGFTPDSFNAALSARVTDRWVYFSGLSAVLPLTD